ncbi:MAG: hypothetical protein AB8B83_01550 [Bdellovibrionales bacterium]
MPDIRADHDRLRERVTEHTSNEFTAHRNWLAQDFFVGQVLPALMLFTEQMSAVAMQQTMSIGMFFDAKHQLETQRLLQEMQVQAHIDYQPSEEFCAFGTNVRSLAASEQRGRANAYVLARRQTARQLGEQNMAGASSGDNDKFGRWQMFTELFCDPQDSDWVSTRPAETGLNSICNKPSSANDAYTNADIDYGRVVGNSRTLNIDEFGLGISFISSGFSINEAGKSITALQNNLYGHNIIQRLGNRRDFAQDRYQSGYMALRSIIAKRSVAENSFNAIVGLKSQGSFVIGSTADSETYRFLGPLMVELGVVDEDGSGDNEDEIRALVGSNPSYYAQLELLAKRIYQNPDFYANLYDKPANVKRKSVALKAIELMVDRAIYESQMRQEMLSSVMLSSKLEVPFIEAEKGLAASAR